MNLEQLEKGQKLKNEIEALKAQKEKFEQAHKIYDISFSVEKVNILYSKSKDIGNVNESFIDFEILKTLALQKIVKAISEAEKEFENL